MTELANILKPIVETACRNALGIVGMRFVDSAPDALNVLAGKRRNGNDRSISHELKTIFNAFAYFSLCIRPFHQVPLVQYHHHSAAALSCHTGNALILVGKADSGVNHQKNNFSTIDCAHGTHEAVILNVFIDNALLAQTSRVDDGVELTLMFHHGIDSVTCGARNVGNDRAIVIGELVRQGRLARIGAADNSNVDGVDLLFFVAFLGEQRNDFIKQIARTGAVKGRNGTRLP